MKYLYLHFYKFVSGIMLCTSLLFLTTSCDYEFVQPKQIITPDSISFEDDIIPIFDASCNFSGCHTLGHSKVDLTPANAYTDIFVKNLVTTGSPDSSLLYTKLVEGGTHNGRSTPAQQAIIKKWIEQGARNN